MTTSTGNSIPPLSNPEHLKRAIGARSLAVAIINVMVGSGIFVLPALVAEGLGAAAIVAYLCCGVLAFLIALCFAELGSSTTQSGGIYTYIERAFGPYAGFLAGNLYLLAALASDAAVANALADTLALFWPSLKNNSYHLLFIFVLYVCLTWLNIRSVKSGLFFVLFTGIGKLIPLVVLVLFAIPHIQAQNLHWTIQPNLDNVGAGSLLLFFAFLGMEVPLCNGGEIKNPQRTVPLGLLGAILGVLALYIGIQVASQGVLGSAMQANTEAPLSAVASSIWGQTGMLLVVAVTAISITGSLSGEILSMPRILFAAARNGLMPKALGKVHAKFATPHISILVYASAGFLLAASGSFRQLAIIASVAVLLVYLGVVAAVIKNRLQPTTAAVGFRMPGGIVAPLLAAAFMVWMLAHSQLKEAIAVSIAIALLSIIYFLVVLIKQEPATQDDK